MKTKAILILSALMVACMSSAQNPTVSSKYSDSEIEAFIQNYKNTRNRDVFPTGVLLQRFQQDFPNARDAEWEMNDEVYEVEFKVSNRDFEAYYDKDGNLLLYKQDIRSSELPAIVKTAAKAQFPTYRFEDVEKIVKGTQTFYKIEMELRNHDVTIYVASDGKIMNELPVY